MRNGILLPLHNTHLVPLETVANSNVEHLDINIFLRTIGQPFTFVCQQHTNATLSDKYMREEAASIPSEPREPLYRDAKNKQNKTKHNISTKTETRTSSN